MSAEYIETTITTTTNNNNNDDDNVTRLLNECFSASGTLVIRMKKQAL